MPVQKTRHDIRRVNEAVPGLVDMVLVSPLEFARRVRNLIRNGQDPHRLLRCLDDVEHDLLRRGIRMRPYFASLRSAARRVIAANRGG